MRFLALLLCLATGGVAGEYAVFASGLRMHVDRHEKAGANVRLYTGAGYIEISADQVQRFEPDDVIPAAPPAAPAAAQPAAGPQQLADAAADKYGLPRTLVRSVMRAESNFQMQAVSNKGAIGLMQLMPSTAQTLGVNPHDPEQNVEGGARYLRGLLEKYNGGLWHALAAYNAGPGAVQKYNGVPPFGETVSFIKKIQRDVKTQ